MFPIAPTRIAHLLQAPEANVLELWPPLETCLDSLVAASDFSKIAALATIHVEDPKFEAARTEKYDGDPQEYFKKYDGRFGNVNPGDGFRYRGRGPAQLTFRGNYRRVGRELGFDLENNPDLALEPNCAAAIFACFFFDKKVSHAADAQNWVAVRKLWNGGTNGLTDFLKYVGILQQELPISPIPVPSSPSETAGASGLTSGR